MKCKKHPYELGASVCASCLRERLLALVAAENALSPEHYHRRRWRPDAPPQHTIALPRSVSPYLSHRGSVASDLRFFSTPQLGPTFRGEVDGGRSRSPGRFSVFKALFGHRRSERVEADWGSCKGSGSSSWFSALIRRKRKQPQHSSAAAEGEARPERWRSRRVVGRGMSPAMEDDEADASGYSTESSTGWRRATPTRRFYASGHQHHHQRGLSSVSGFAVCLSPLMRAGHSGRRSHLAEPAAFSGELRGPAISAPCHRRSPVEGDPLGFGPSRSRKLADFGRFR